MTHKPASISSREYLLTLGTLFFAVSPLLVIVFYAAAAAATFLQWRQIRFDKEKVAVGLLILVISLWMFSKKVLPENYSPGLVAFTDYVPLFIFFYVMSLVPFSDSECEHFSYALLTTVPQHFWIACLEKFDLSHMRGLHQVVINGVPIVDIFIGSFEPGLSVYTVSSTFYNPNIFALYGVIVFAVSCGLFLREIENVKTYDKAVFRLWLRIIFLCSCLILSLVLILWTHSKNGLAAVAFIALCHAILRKKVLLLTTIGGGIIVFLFLALLNLGLPSRLARDLAPTATVEGFSESFSGTRPHIYSCAEQLVKERPITGWGIGMVKEICEHRVDEKRVSHAHNIVLQLAAEIGLPFTAVVVCLFSYILIVSIRRLITGGVDWKVRDLDLTCLVAVGAVLMMQIFDLALLMTYRLNFLFWICFAIPYSRALQEKRQA